jgi:TIR domain
MSDIFISYKREEQATARKLANALESESWTVWWDPKLRAGEHFDDVIEKALDEAKCVIVMWSELSVQSRYVRDEATHALERGKLVPLAIETVELPFRFKGVQMLSLLGWDGSKDLREFRRLVEDIAAIVGPPVTEAKRKDENKGRNRVQQKTPTQRRRKKKRPEQWPEQEAKPMGDEVMDRLLKFRKEALSQPDTASRDKLKDDSQGPRNHVFLNYASLDNEQLRSNRPGCWVEEFARVLTSHLSVRLGTRVRQVVGWVENSTGFTTARLRRKIVPW